MALITNSNRTSTSNHTHNCFIQIRRYETQGRPCVCVCVSALKRPASADVRNSQPRQHPALISRSSRKRRAFIRFPHSTSAFYGSVPPLSFVPTSSNQYPISQLPANRQPSVTYAAANVNRPPPPPPQTTHCQLNPVDYSNYHRLLRYRNIPIPPDSNGHSNDTSAIQGSSFHHLHIRLKEFRVPTPPATRPATRPTHNLDGPITFHSRPMTSVGS